MTKIRIAVIGSGLAGSSLANGLSQYSHLDAHVFESNDELVTPGFAFGIYPHAQDALALLSPTAGSCLERAGGVPNSSVRSYLASGPQSGELIIDVGASMRVNSVVVNRASFLKELQKDVPPDHMHVSKRLKTIEHLADGAILIHFEDGSSHECDILVGTDGIHSAVRKHILGDDIAVTPRNSGMWAIMTLNPYEKARETLGDELLDRQNPCSHAWFGDGFFMLTNMLDHGTTVQFSVAALDESAVNSSEWKKELTRDDIINTFINKGAPSRLEKTVTALICDQPGRTAFYLREHRPARTYIDGPVCIAGDAAHTTTPWQAAGGAMSIEDSFILSSLLAKATSPAEARAALKAYDQTRRPRTQHIVQTGSESGSLLTGKCEGVGLDKDKFREHVLKRWAFIVGWDAAKCRDEALQLMKQLQSEA